MTINKKVLVFDIDGTLLNTKKQIPAKTLEAINLARANGHIVTIATGRGNFMIEEIIEELNLDTYICFNGQYVVYENKCVHKDGIDHEVLNEIVEYGLNKNHDFIFQAVNKMTTTTENCAVIKDALKTINLEYPEVNKDFFKQEQIHQTLLFVTAEDEVDYKEKFKNVQFVRWHKNSCDILPLHGFKSFGIEILLKHLNMSMEDVIAFGDGLNDYEMIRDAGLGVCMGNGHENLKAIADVIAPHVDEDGIYKIMKELNLI